MYLVLIKISYLILISLYFFSNKLLKILYIIYFLNIFNL